jgi:hypothetical protein
MLFRRGVRHGPIGNADITLIERVEWLTWEMLGLQILRGNLRMQDLRSSYYFFRKWYITEVCKNLTSESMQYQIPQWFKCFDELMLENNKLAARTD